MEIQQLRYFVAAAEAGSMSRAAERCGVAQPSLSQQVQRLEGALGVALFDRLGRGVALTDAGRALLPRARRILAEVREVEEGLEAEAASGAGRLSIGAIPTMAPYLLPQLLRELRARSSGAEFEVREDVTERLLEALADRELDVAILSTPIEHAGVESRVVGSEELVVAAARGHAIASAGVVSASRLRDEPMIVLDEAHCLGRQLGAFCASRGVGRNIVCRSAQLPTVLEFVGRGLGVSIVPAMAARAESARSGARFVRFKRPAPRREVAVAWRAGRRAPGVVDRIAEVVGKRLGGAG